jgi:chromate transporter
MWESLVDVALVMTKISMSAVAGSGTILGEMMQETVGHGWLTAQQFVSAYALSQLAPGPAALVVVPIGYRAGGVLGAIVALLAFSIPTALVTSATVSAWGRVRAAPWAQTGRTALMPVAVGLVLAAAVTFARNSISDVPGAIIAATAFMLIWRMRASAAAVVFGGIAVGAALGLLFS